VIKARVDVALLAVDGTDVALAKSYIKQTPIYTSNQVNENLSREARFDLQDVRFVEIPWLVDPDGGSYAGIKRSEYANATLDRLYALGIDAFRVAQAFEEGNPRTARFRRRDRPSVARREPSDRARRQAHGVSARARSCPPRRVSDAQCVQRARSPARRRRHLPPSSSPPAA
jgi:hypothetical protein